VDACVSHLGEAKQQKASAGMPEAVEMSRTDSGATEWSFKANRGEAANETVTAS
jgi:hypothetical protein